MGRSTVNCSTCFLEAGGEGREGVEGEPVECNVLGVACNLDAWWGGRDGIGKDSSDNCIFCSARHSVIQKGGQRIWFWDQLREGSFSGVPSCKANSRGGIRNGGGNDHCYTDKNTFGKNHSKILSERSLSGDTTIAETGHRAASYAA
jgi:hypothetical protein